MSNEATEPEPVSGEWDSPGTSPEADEYMDDEEF